MRDERKNQFNLINLDINYSEMLSSLRRVGLSEYESRAYIALVAQGRGTAEEIARIGGIPRTSSYKTLESLRSKGFVHMHDSRPAIFYPVSPTELKKDIIGAIGKAFDILENLQGVLSEKGTPQLVYTIMGKDKILAKIGEMLDGATTRFFLSTPTMTPIRTLHSQRFKEAVKRGVEVIIVAEPFIKVPECTRVHRRPDLIATDVISDGRTALIASPDYSICGYSDNPFLVGHLEVFMLSPLKETRPLQ
ncbi:MAG: helix-turn-helix domain-containing protein [Methanomassiliicoccales archaeon]|jgi:sugar-specific transcriptional regulator TrmB|nr:helix-turn-helix domain-containing protein [Methanomassiliicoccales archaeon]